MCVCVCVCVCVCALMCVCLCLCLCVPDDAIGAEMKAKIPDGVCPVE